MKGLLLHLPVEKVFPVAHGDLVPKDQLSVCTAPVALGLGECQLTVGTYSDKPSIQSRKETL